MLNVPNSFLARIHDFSFLLATLTLFFALRLPSLFEPYWYGDEGIYQAIGIALQDGRSLYKEIWDNKPPLLYMLYMFLSSDQFMVRLTSILFGIGAIIAFHKLAEKLFLPNKIASHAHGKHNRYIVHGVTIGFAALFGLPLLEGNIANAENFMLFPIILAATLIVDYVQNRKHTVLAIAGVSLSIAFLFKIVGIFDFAAFSIFLLISTYRGEMRFLAQCKKLLPFFLGFFLPIFATILYFTANGTFTDFFNAAFKQNIGYVGYGNKLLIPQGLLILKACILGGIVLFLFLKRSMLTKTALFILLWFTFSTFNAFFSARPYTHYMLVLLPSFLLLLGFIFWQRAHEEEQHRKTFALSQRLGVISLIVVLLFVLQNFWFYDKFLAYYQNFFSFVTMKKSVVAYRAFFDRNTPKDYELAQFINSRANKKEGLFVWGNNAHLYKLTNKLPPGRYTVAYHITASKESMRETEEALHRAKPKFIITTARDNIVPFSLARYRLRIAIRDALIYERVF